MPASQLSSAVRVIEERRGSSLFAFAYILPSVTRGQSVLVCVCMLISWGWIEGHTMVLPLSLTYFGLSCIFNPSNAKLSVVLFGGTLFKSVNVPHHLVSRDNGV